MSHPPPGNPPWPPQGNGPGHGYPPQPFTGSPPPQPQQPPQWQPPFQPQYAPSPGPPPASGPPRRRLVWVGVLSAVGTLLVAGGVTAGTVYARGDFRQGTQHIHASLPQDPCASVDDAGLNGLDATELNRYATVYESHCTWNVELDVAKAVLSVEYMRPMSEDDAAVAEEQGEEPITDPEELFADRRDFLSDPSPPGLDSSVLDKEKAAPGFGDQSTLMWFHTGTTDIDEDYKADLLIRDGQRVTTVGLRADGEDGILSMYDAEPLLKDLAQHVDWQQG